VTLFTPDQWLIVALVFLLGMVLGAALMAGGKWKRRYREERDRCAELEAENRRLQKDAGEMDTLRQAAARDEARKRTDGPGPL
jgi:outer membrane murein-binding lipoprotein Lpp